MKEEELINVIGGGTAPSATFLNAISRGVEACYNLGKACGTAIRMLISRKKCSI